MKIGLNKLSFLASLFAVLFCFSCCSAAGNSRQSTSGSTDEILAEESSAEGSISEEIIRYTSVEEYLSDPVIQNSLSEVIAAAEADGTLTAEIYADGSTLVYKYVFTDSTNLSDMDLRDALIKSLAVSASESRDTFDKLRSTLSANITDPDLAIRLVYLAADGTHLYSCTFDDSGKLLDIAEYLEDESVQEELRKPFAASEPPGTTLKLYALGNSLVYDRAYNNPVDLSHEVLLASEIAYWAAVSEENRAAYESIADILPLVINGDHFTVRLIYRNADGSVIYTCEFK